MFAPDSKIMLIDGEEKRISDIKRNDKILFVGDSPTDFLDDCSIIDLFSVNTKAFSIDFSWSWNSDKIIVDGRQEFPTSNGSRNVSTLRKRDFLYYYDLSIAVPADRIERGNMELIKIVADRNCKIIVNRIFCKIENRR